MAATCTSGSEGARRAGSPQPASPPRLDIDTLHESLFISDSWSAISAAQAEPPFLAWDDPAGGLAFVAWGQIAHSGVGQHWASDARAAAPSLASAWCSSIEERYRGDALLGEPLPLVIGGASFDGRPGRDAWQRWPGALLWVPRVLIYRRSDGSGGMLYRSLRGERSPSPAAISAAPPAPSGVAMEGPWASSPAREGYCALVRRAVNDIAGGRIDKVVLARHERVEAPEGMRFDGVASALALRAGCDPHLAHGRADAAPTHFALGVDRAEVFVGATPEILVRAAGQRLITHAVAGTSAVEDDRDGSRLLESDKDRREHAWVVGSIRDALGPLSESVQIGDAELLRAGSVHHLATPIRAKLRADRHVMDAVVGLHPTAALCGAPTAGAARWLAEHEPIARGWYGAPIGWADANGGGAFMVAIRSLLVTPREAYAFAGAGIVQQSSAEDEWRETRQKMRAAKRALRVEVAP